MAMDFFNKTKESLKSMGDTITQKASDVSGGMQLSAQIRDEEKKLSAALQEMGRELMDKDPETARRMDAALTEQIMNLSAQLGKDRRDLAISKGKKICPNCGAELDKDALFCTSCGIQLPVAPQPQPTQSEPQPQQPQQQQPEPMPQAQPMQPQQQQPAQKICPNCGAAVKADAHFCTECGTKLD